MLFVNVIYYTCTHPPDSCSVHIFTKEFILISQEKNFLIVLRFCDKHQLFSKKRMNIFQIISLSNFCSNPQMSKLIQTRFYLHRFD